MQQYFVNTKICINQLISLDDDIIYHLTKVLRKSEKEFRVVDKEGRIFLARLENDKAYIINELDENNELDINVTALISIIKQDKFEFILQKLCELGVKTIIPVKTAYSNVFPFSNNKIIRFNKILKEAAEQSHRNLIPDLLNPIDFKDVIKYKSDLNIVSYEKSNKECISLKSNAITYFIGPEGGFSIDEVKFLLNNDFIDISLGKRILRAETAAITLMSYVLKDNQ